jgi:hypothetical protein
MIEADLAVDADRGQRHRPCGRRAPWQTSNPLPLTSDV